MVTVIPGKPYPVPPGGYPSRGRLLTGRWIPPEGGGEYCFPGRGTRGYREGMEDIPGYGGPGGRQPIVHPLPPGGPREMEYIL